jgi:parallel beta-helix repeat protein
LTVTVKDVLRNDYGADAKVLVNNYISPSLYPGSTKARCGYLIESDGLGLYRAIDGETGVVAYSETVFEKVMQKCINDDPDYIYVKNLTAISYYPIVVNVSDIRINAEKGTTLTMPALASAVTVTSNVETGESRIFLSSTSAFRAGQYITYTDDTYDDHYETKCGKTYLITSVGRDGVNVYPSIQAGDTVATSFNARTVPSYCFFYVDGVSNVEISGFTLNGNKNNRVRIQGLRPGVRGEAYYADVGISLNDCANVTLKDNNVSNMVLHGIDCHLVSNSQIFENTVSGVNDKSIVVWYSENVRVCKNIIENPVNEDGIILYTANNNVIVSENIVTLSVPSSRYGIYARASPNTVIANNTLSGQGSCLSRGNPGIEVYTGSNNSVVTGNSVNSFGGDCGISIKCSWVTVSNNKVSDCNFGIIVWGSAGAYPSNVIVTSNSVNRSRSVSIGFQYNVSNSKIINNIVVSGNCSDTHDAISLRDECTYNMIAGNRIGGSNSSIGYAIREDTSDYNVFIGNVAYAGSATCIYTSGSHSKVNFCNNSTSWIS